MFISKHRFYLMWTIAIVVSMAIATCNIARASDWTFNIMGITPKHFESRDWKIVVVGAVSSFIVHEAGHLLWAHTHGGGHFDWGERAVIMDDYYERSHGEQQMFHRAGFLAQIAVGGLLTTIPKTRHSDFAVGFNSLATFEVSTYLLFDHGDKEISDIRQLDHGVAEGIVYTLGMGTLTYINIKKPCKD